MTTYTTPPVAPGFPMVDVASGVLTPMGLRLVMSLIERTGGFVGMSVADVDDAAHSAAMAMFADVADVPAPDMMPFLMADPVDSTDASGALPMFSDPVETVPDMGEPALLALALGDVA